MELEKITIKPRSYDDSCAAAHALDLVGERWALLVMRELMFGPRRFGDLRVSLPGLSANVLTQRLEGLEEDGVIIKRKLPPPASVQVYELTGWGREAEPIILSLGRWGARSPALEAGLSFSAVSAMLSFRAMFDADLASGHDLALGFRFGQEGFVVRVRGGEVHCARGEAESADVVLTCEPYTAVLAVYRLVPVAELEVQGKLKVEGDRSVLERFSGIFRLPAKAG